MRWYTQQCILVLKGTCGALVLKGTCGRLRFLHILQTKLQNACPAPLLFIPWCKFIIYCNTTICYISSPNSINNFFYLYQSLSIAVYYISLHSQVILLDLPFTYHSCFTLFLFLSCVVFSVVFFICIVCIFFPSNFQISSTISSQNILLFSWSYHMDNSALYPHSCWNCSVNFSNSTYFFTIPVVLLVNDTTICIVIIRWLVLMVLFVIC